jgi:hypothetical protein
MGFQWMIDSGCALMFSLLDDRHIIWHKSSLWNKEGQEEEEAATM